MQCHSTVFLSRDWGVGVCLCLPVTEELNPLLLSHPQELENIDTWSQVLTSDVKPNEVWPVWQIRKWFSNKHCFTQQTIANTFVIKALFVSSCDHLPGSTASKMETSGAPRTRSLSSKILWPFRNTWRLLGRNCLSDADPGWTVSNLSISIQSYPTKSGAPCAPWLKHAKTRYETSVTIRDIPPSRSQISSSPGQDECWQECAKGAMCWEMVNPKTIDIYWLYTSIHYTETIRVKEESTSDVLRIFRICI